LPCRPHSWDFNEPYYAIDQGFERFDHVVLPNERGSVGKIALFHYVLKCAPAQIRRECLLTVSGPCSSAGFAAVLVCLGGQQVHQLAVPHRRD